MRLPLRFRPITGLVLLVVALSFLPVEWSAAQGDKAEEYATHATQLSQAGDLKGAEAELRRAVATTPDRPLY